MNDLISRQAAIEIVERYNKSHMVLKQRPMLGAAPIVIELMELPSVQPEQRWIPVSERLPEKDNLVLATVWDAVVIAWRNIYGGWESAEDMYEKGDVTAWMPTPEPYKGGDTE